MRQGQRSYQVLFSPAKLYWHCGPAPPLDVFFFITDKLFVYRPFCRDFGPLSLADVYNYNTQLRRLLDEQEEPVYHHTSEDQAHRANSAFLCCAFQMLVLGRTADEALARFGSVRFQPFRDVSRGPSLHDCTLQHCLKGLQYAVRLGWFSLQKFNVKEYQYYRQSLDLNWIVPNKLIALCSPAKGDSVAEYVAAFSQFGVDTVVRLNSMDYDPQPFRQAGIRHYELQFDDGTVPTLHQVSEFIGLVETAQGAVAVHCEAGLGRTGTMIGCYAIQKYHFDPAWFIGYIRICRPGSVYGRQQQFLLKFARAKAQTKESKKQHKVDENAK